jgi:hypothetical protein
MNAWRGAHTIYSDAIAPGLARLDRTVRGSRRNLLKSFTHSSGRWFWAISSVIYTGLLPNQLVGVTQGLRVTKVLADLGRVVLQHVSAKDPLKNEHLCFLSRLRHASRQRPEFA